MQIFKSSAQNDFKHIQKNEGRIINLLLWEFYKNKREERREAKSFARYSK